MMSINTQLVRIELVISVDQEHGTRMDNMASTPATYPVIQVGHTTMTVIVEKKKNTAITIIVYVHNDLKETNTFLLCRLKINHMIRCNLCAYS
jgi:hypothetical protein